MGQIYQSARRVVIDIGETSNSSDEALHAIMHCSEQTLYAMDLGLRIKDAVSKLYERAWFGRVWVLQEAFRSKEAVVLCGTGLVPWSIFRPFRIWVDSRPAGETEHWHVALPSMVPPALTVGNHHSRTYTAREDLLSLLVKGSTCDAVFAVLPMLADAPAENSTRTTPKALPKSSLRQRRGFCPRSGYPSYPVRTRDRGSMSYRRGCLTGALDSASHG